jgi:hypothetical protein
VSRAPARAGLEAADLAAGRTPMQERVRAIAPHFATAGELRRVVPHGSGHIHDTFLAEYDDAGSLRRFLHQRLNTKIFRDPEGLMRNVVRVTDHLRSKLVRGGSAWCPRCRATRCTWMRRATPGEPMP